MEEKDVRNSPKHSVSLFSTSSEKMCDDMKTRAKDACVSTLVGRIDRGSNDVATTRIAPATLDGGFPLTSADILFTGSVNSVRFPQNVPACLLPQTKCAFPLHYVSAGTRQQARRAITAQSKSGSRQAHVGNYFQNRSPEVWSPDHHCQSSLASWWGSGVPSHQRRSLPCLSPAGMLKKTQHLHVQSSLSSHFHRSTSFSGQISPIQQNVSGGAFDDFVAQNDYLLVYPDHAAHSDAVTYATFENPSCEESPVEQQQGVLRNNPCFQEGSIPDDRQLDHSLPNLGSSQSATKSTVEKSERFSRKVFIGGLPPDIDEEEITAAFRRFGPLVVDWPHKAESKSYFPPKGYCFLIFQEELSVQNFIEMCLVDEEKMYWCVSSPTMKDKPVQVRPWTLSDSDFVMDGSQPLDPRKTIFVGGVPRPLRAVELAMIMDRLYGGVCYAGIDTDPELKYPKGAGRVAFSNQQSYIAAISARFVQLQHGDIDKRVEVKPYVLDDQMCDECHGSRCAGKFAPFFCASVTCLQYYCEYCWAQIHSRPGREYHKPLVKEGADRPRAVPFRWC